MILSQYFFPLRGVSLVIIAFVWDLVSSQTQFSQPFKPAGYDSLIPVFNSTREARRSVVSGGLFSIVSFDNVPCLADSGDIGTCYSGRECTNVGGTSLGVCAGNYGVCCVITPTCGSTITTNNTYFINPSSVTGPSACSVTIAKLAGAAELYLEFTAFSIAGPTLGICLNDTFTISLGGTTLALPALCGYNTGQMIYFPISSISGPFKLTFTLGVLSFTRSWKIRIVQFFSTDACAAPSGCNQYLQGLTGSFETFNYNSGQGQLINNYCQTICFALQPGYCNVLLTENEFMLSGTAPTTCSGDYLLVGGKQFCGDTLSNGMLLTNQTSIQFCSGTANPDMDLGFSLNYTLVPCSSTG